ncbi:MAG: alkene reductase [Desulfatibacillaceae bacterium]
MSEKSIDMFTPIQVGPLTLPNRVFMAPMTRNRAGEGNVPTDLNAKYYAQRAGAGLILTEATQVSPRGVGYPNTPGIHTREQAEGWKKVVDAVHDAGGRISLQLWHVGRISHPSLQPEGDLPVAPSAVKPEGECYTYEGPKPFVTPRALETPEIQGVVEEFRRGAELARDVGFDGVEVHGANGYLIDQFLRDGANQRTDEYGGSVENRARFLLEVVDAVCGVWDSPRVGIRISPINDFNDMSDSNPDALFGHVVEELSKRNLAYLDVMELAFGGLPEGAPGCDFGRLREKYDGIYVANGELDKAKAEKVLAEGHADAVMFGRLYLANPDLVERLKRDAPLNDWDQDTFYGGGEKGYTDYPFLDE